MATIKWQLDPAHSEVEFKVRHMMVSTVSGEFQDFDAQLETDDYDFASAKATFSADVGSISTKVEQRDNHLKSEDFFDAESHPKLTFESTNINKISDEEYELQGDLTIRGVTNPVTLKVEHHGVVKDPQGNQRTGFDISGKIKRLDFGLKYNPAMEAGGVVVGDEVRIAANVEFLHKSED
jgi:polyisoprenoid-binding protein YceI